MTDTQIKAAATVTTLLETGIEKPFVVFWYQPVVGATGVINKQYLRVFDMCATEVEAEQRSNELSQRLGLDVIFYDQRNGILPIMPSLLGDIGGRVLRLDELETQPSTQGQASDVDEKEKADVSEDMVADDHILKDKILEPIELYTNYKINSFIYKSTLKSQHGIIKGIEEKAETTNELIDAMEKDYPGLDCKWVEEARKKYSNQDSGAGHWETLKKLVAEFGGLTIE